MAVGKERLKNSAKSGFLVSVIFSLSLHSLQWLFEDEYRWTNWLAGISTDLVKIAIAGAAGYFSGLLVIAGAAALKLGVIAVIPVGVGILVAIGVGSALNYFDKQYQITQRLILFLEKKEAEVKRPIYDGAYYLMLSTAQTVKKQLSQAAIERLHSVLRFAPRIQIK